VLAAEVIESKLNVYLTAADEDKAVVKEELSSLIEAAGNDYKGLYAHMRALNAEAQVLAEEGDWTGAAASYIAIADNFPDSYMAPVSLLNASAMEEESGDIETALTLLERVIAEYKDLSADIPEALFNMGRLNEGLGDPVKAQEYYNRISDDYSSSSWTNLAKSRIIALNARS
jgi:tetratricopeptide (TPR) repeat protein